MAFPIPLSGKTFLILSFSEFWEHHFHCRYPNSSKTPYTEKHAPLCSGKEKLTRQNTVFEDQLQFVSDAVMAFAYAIR
jgi:metabotropic X receptor